VNRLEGANCSGLPGFVIDKYFDCNASAEPLRRMVALAICANCQVVDACREQALNGPRVPRGVIGGVTAVELNRAKQWRRYEQGLTEVVPSEPRPGWLPMTDATQIVEQGRVEGDPDEPVDR
jgi:hypothetical protein